MQWLIYGIYGFSFYRKLRWIQDVLLWGSWKKWLTWWKYQLFSRSDSLSSWSDRRESWKDWFCELFRHSHWNWLGKKKRKRSNGCGESQWGEAGGRSRGWDAWTHPCVSCVGGIYSSMLVVEQRWRLNGAAPSGTWPVQREVKSRRKWRAAEDGRLIIVSCGSSGFFQGRRWTTVTHGQRLDASEDGWLRNAAWYNDGRWGLVASFINKNIQIL